MRIEVDFDLCVSHGMCESIAPDVFEIDEDDYLQVHEDKVGAADRSDLERAVASCPMSALSLVEE